MKRSLLDWGRAVLCCTDFQFHVECPKMEERGRLCAKCTDLASFPECLTDPAASSQLRPRPPGLRAIGAPVLHDYAWTLSRKECLGTALPGPS